MSKDSPIKQSDNWFIGEDRTLRFSVIDSAGLAQNISGWTLILRKKSTKLRESTRRSLSTMARNVLAVFIL